MFVSFKNVFKQHPIFQCHEPTVLHWRVVKAALQLTQINFVPVKFFSKLQTFSWTFWTPPLPLSLSNNLCNDTLFVRVNLCNHPSVLVCRNDRTCVTVTQREDDHLPVASLLPSCQDVDWNKTSTMLDLPAMVMLNHAVQAELRKEWRYLFSTRQHGESFSTLLKHVLNQGPTLLVVRDKEGHIFGGYSTISLSPRPQFVGKLDGFKATGYHRNAHPGNKLFQ